ncbi:MAG: hypothetical protein HQ591_08030 [candidate division Zixibacteria bacterium]|nr:hypothetical protein [Candidatus Tariuqbacter arcticus]
MSSDPKSPKISRDHFSVVPLNDKSDKKYWQSRTAEERLEHLQFLRRLNYGDSAAGRMMKVFEVVKMKSYIRGK